MSGTDFTPRGTVNLEFWSKHLESKIFAGFDLILWPRKAGTWKLGTVFTPCNRKSALAIIESGIVRKAGKYKDGKGVRYVLKEGIEAPTKKKRRSNRKAKPKVKVVEEPIIEDASLVEVETEDFEIDIETQEPTEDKSKAKAKPKAKPKTKAKAKPKTKPKPKAKAKPKAKPKPKTKAKPKAKPKPKSRAKSSKKK